jgi:hypothetical protein
VAVVASTLGMALVGLPVGWDVSNMARTPVHLEGIPVTAEPDPCCDHCLVAAHARFIEGWECQSCGAPACAHFAWTFGP